MDNFLVIYRLPSNAKEIMEKTPEEEKEKEMEVWKKWGEDNKDFIVDFGNPVGSVTHLKKDSSEDSHDNMAGYSIVRAESLDEVKEKLKNNPHLSWSDDCVIDIYPIVNME